MYFYNAEPAAEFGVLQNTQTRSQLTQTVRYDCSKCDSFFTTRLYLHQHESTAHNRIFHCPFCEALFSNKDDFGVHLIAHTEKKHLPCSFCKKVFHDVDEYATHVKLHTEPFMYKCDKCSAMFSQLSKLRTHSAAHVNRKFIHTIPKFSKRLVSSHRNQLEDNSSNPAENNVGTTAASVTSATQASQTEVPSSPAPSVQVDSESSPPQEPEAGCSRSFHETRETSRERSLSPSNKKQKQKANKRERPQRILKCSTKLAETKSRSLPVNNTEISPMKENVPSNSEFRRVLRKRVCPLILEKTSDPKNSCETTADGSLRISSVTSLKIKKPIPAKKLEKVQKPKSLLKNAKLKSKNCECTGPVTIQSALSNVPVSKVTILKPVTASNSLVDQCKPNKAPISRVTFLKPVSRLSSSVELNRPNEVTSSASHNSITDQADKMQNESRGLDKSNRSNELADTAAKSSNVEVSEMVSQNADSVYTFAEEESSNKTPTSNTEQTTTKRHRSELWRFFLSPSNLPKKKAKSKMLSKRRKSVHFYKCLTCIRNFPNNNLLSKHELLHAENRGILCNLCGGVFGGRGNLIVHRKLTHNLPS